MAREIFLKTFSAKIILAITVFMVHTLYMNNKIIDVMNDMRNGVLSVEDAFYIFKTIKTANLSHFYKMMKSADYKNEYAQLMKYMDESDKHKGLLETKYRVTKKAVLYGFDDNNNIVHGGICGGQCDVQDIPSMLEGDFAKYNKVDIHYKTGMGKIVYDKVTDDGTFSVVDADKYNVDYYICLLYKDTETGLWADSYHKTNNIDEINQHIRDYKIKHGIRPAMTEIHACLNK